MRLGLAFGALALLCASAVTAQSSDPYGRRTVVVSPAYNRAGPETARAIVRDFAQCNAKYGHDSARNFLLVAPGTRLPDDEFLRAADPRCLGLMRGRLRMSELGYR